MRQGGVPTASLKTSDRGRTYKVCSSIFILSLSTNIPIFFLAQYNPSTVRFEQQEVLMPTITSPPPVSSYGKFASPRNFSTSRFEEWEVFEPTSGSPSLETSNGCLFAPTATSPFTMTTCDARLINKILLLITICIYTVY